MIAMLELKHNPCCALGSTKKGWIKTKVGNSFFFSQTRDFPDCEQEIDDGKKDELKSKKKYNSVNQNVLYLSWYDE